MATLMMNLNGEIPAQNSSNVEINNIDSSAIIARVKRGDMRTTKVKFTLPRTVTMDDLIESAAMQELRICCLELGIDPNEFIEEDMNDDL